MFPREGANINIVYKVMASEIFRPCPLLLPRPRKWPRMSTTATVWPVLNLFGTFFVIMQFHREPKAQGSRGGGLQLIFVLKSMVFKAEGGATASLALPLYPPLDTS